MAVVYKPGDTAFIITNGRVVQEVQIISRIQDLYTVRFADYPALTRLRATRLYPTYEKAEEALPERKPVAPKPVDRKKYKMPWEV